MSRRSTKKAIEKSPYHASEEAYQALFEQAADGIFIADREGDYVEVNRHGCKMLGYTRKEILNLSLQDLIPAEDLARDPLQLDTLRAGKTLLKERRLRCNDGRLLPVEISARMLTDGRFLAIVRDISERKRTEEQLRESNERFRLLAESSLSSIYLIQEGRFRYVNPALAHVFGYEVEEVIDRLGPLDLVYPDDRPLVAENIRRRTAGEVADIRYDFRGLRKDGSVIYVEVHGRRIEYGGKMGVIGTLVDMTERKQAEEALRRSRETELQFSKQLAVLQEATNQLSKAESADDLCRQAVQLAHLRLGFDRVSIWFIEEHLGIMRGSFGTDERGELRDERNAQVEFRHEGLAWRVFSHKESMALVEYRPLRNHLGQEVGEGDNAMAALWDGDEVIGIISVDNLITHQPIRGRQLEILRLYATTLGHLITRKWAEEQFRESNQRFRTFVDHATDAFFLLDDQTNVLDVNRQACENLGYSREELIGMTVADFDADLASADVKQNQARLDSGELIAFDSRHRRKDGTVFPVEIRIRPFREAKRRFGVALVRDITERKQAEEALRASEARFRMLVEQATDAFFLGDERGSILDVNRQTCESLGYTRAELIGMTSENYDANPNPAFLEKVRARLATGEAITFDTVHRRKDGTMFPVEVRARWFWQDGRRFGLALARDVTERKQAQEALTLFRTLIDHTNDAIEVIDPETGRFLDGNEQACRALGYTREEFLNLTIAEINPLVAEQSWQDTVDELRRTDSFVRESKHQRKDGSIFPVEVNINYIRLDHDYVLAVVRDITRRKRIEESLRQREAQLQHIIDTVPEGVLLLDTNGHIYLTNPVAEQYLAVLATGQKNGRLTHLGERPLPELLTSPPKGLWHEITSNEHVFEAIARPVENSSQNGGWVLVLRDITQERDIQRQVQRQERLAAVGQLAAGIAHDFNNILAVINLYAQFLSRTVALPTRARERLHTIEQQAKRAADLIQQILDFSRQSILERQPLDLLPFLEKLVTLLERTLPEHIQIELDHGTEAYFIRADPSRIQQVLMNLAVNARDAMPEGGHLQIRLTRVQTAAPRPMPVQDLPPGDWVQIAVADSGGGIPPKALAHIFEPFFTTKEVGEGTGLGLAQVYGIVQQHEGYIDVATEVGEGTTFFLYFPALETGENAADMPDRSVLQSGQGQRVLVVEDDLATREALLDSLTLMNYEVIAASNGREALAILATKADEVELVLSDTVMPEMGGIALFHAMREQKLTIPVVLLTGHALSQEMENLQTLGLTGWLPKPPDLVSLSYLLADVLTVSPG